MTEASTQPDSGASEALEARAAATERLTFFADAVIAIAITLLALDLPVPTGETNAEVLQAVVGDREAYVAFLISFAVIGAHWRGHHQTFRYVTTVGDPLFRLTLYWLLMQVITPFATRVLIADGAFQVRFIFYASVQCAAGILFLFMVRDIRRHGQLRPGTPPALLHDVSVRTATLAAAFLVSIPFSLVTHAAYAFWAVIPLTGAVVRRLARRRSPKSPADRPPR